LGYGAVGALLSPLALICQIGCTCFCENIIFTRCRIGRKLGDEKPLKLTAYLFCINKILSAYSRNWTPDQIRENVIPNPNDVLVYRSVFFSKNSYYVKYLYKYNKANSRGALTSTSTQFDEAFHWTFSEKQERKSGAKLYNNDGLYFIMRFVIPKNFPIIDARSMGLLGRVRSDKSATSMSEIAILNKVLEGGVRKDLMFYLKKIQHISLSGLLNENQKQFLQKLNIYGNVFLLDFSIGYEKIPFTPSYFSETMFESWYERFEYGVYVTKGEYDMTKVWNSLYYRQNLKQQEGLTFDLELLQDGGHKIRIEWNDVNGNHLLCNLFQFDADPNHNKIYMTSLTPHNAEQCASLVSVGKWASLH